MVVDKDFLAGVRTLFQATFDQIIGDSTPSWPKFATKIDTGGKATLTFNWLGTPPMLRTMKDTLTFGKAFPHDYTVTVTENGVGIEISESSFMSDPLGTISMFVRNMMRQAERYEDKVAAAALSDGFSTTLGLGFDGAAFFADTHTFGDAANYDNKVATNLAADGVAYNLGWAAINTAQGDDGSPLGLVPTVLVVHSNGRLIARQMLNSTITTGGISNVLQGDVELVVSPWLTDTADTVLGNQWYLLSMSQEPGPIVLVEQMPKRFVASDGLDSDSAFEKNVYRYKVDNKLAVGYGDPRCAYGSTGT